jgi:hypothetical protein
MHRRHGKQKRNYYKDSPLSHLASSFGLFSMITEAGQAAEPDQKGKPSSVLIVCLADWLSRSRKVAVRKRTLRPGVFDGTSAVATLSAVKSRRHGISRTHSPVDSEDLSRHRASLF